MRHGHPSVIYEPRRKELAKLLRGAVRQGDIVLTLGAGDIWKVGDAFVRAAAKEAAASGRRRKRT